MKGIIIKNHGNITQFNNKFFGRVIQVKRNNRKFLYYYPGAFHNVKYYKFANNCYFLQVSDIGLITLEDQENIKIIKADVEIDIDYMYTGREYFQRKFSNKRVVNLE